MASLISHRGNLEGPNPSFENYPAYIDTVLNRGLDCEVDVHVVDGAWYLGHDTPQYRIDLVWLKHRAKQLWIHAKNRDAFDALRFTALHYFWHQSDDIALTSGGFGWTCLPDMLYTNAVYMCASADWLTQPFPPCYAVCTDYIP